MKESLTPIRLQYLSIKNQHPNAIVLFRLGDFYETFDEDARVASQILSLVLTSRSMGKDLQVPMAGIPHHALDDYLGKLVKAGHRVAICEQLSKPSAQKGLVERAVVRIVTPGTITEPNLLQTNTNNYLVSVSPGNEWVGVAYVDITTSEFACTQLLVSRLQNEIDRLSPAELIAPENTPLHLVSAERSHMHLDSRWFDLQVAQNALLKHFDVTTLEGYGCDKMPHAIKAAGSILHYIETTQKSALQRLTRLSTYSTESYMTIDAYSLSNLEVFKGLSSGSSQGSLLSVIDTSKTAMGGRLLRKWLGQPLISLPELITRQNTVSVFFNDSLLRQEITAVLGNIVDIERIMTRIQNNTVLPRELVSLRHSLEWMPRLIELLSSTVLSLSSTIKPIPQVVQIISDAIEENPHSTPGEGGVIRNNYSAELDSLIQSTRQSRQYLAGLERQEREKTGIKNLKIGFNNIFGYYIEVSNSNTSQVPAEYIRKQTLSTGERYYTTELKEFESLILNAKDRLNELETLIYNSVCQEIATYSEELRALATAIAELDVFTTLAEVALRNRYTRPILENSLSLKIKGGRHPIAERFMPQGHFVANDLDLSENESQIIVLTGPNMAGKSTYLKQIALIVLMAQIGSYVPAEEATIGLVDRVFTRIGAREDLSSGKSTFMVEMIETAGILNNATPRSLLIMDEIGRGTSTYDGLAIAQAVVEYIHNSLGGARTLFATHYHELVSLSDYLPRTQNFNVAVVEENENVVFMHKIVAGGVDKSYGIHVAKLAGIPRSVIKRAKDVLQKREPSNSDASHSSNHLQNPSVVQLSFFTPKDTVSRELEKLEVDSLSPLEALHKLYEFKQKALED